MYYRLADFTGIYAREDFSLESISVKDPKEKTPSILEELHLFARSR